MYIWILLASFVTALFAFNLSVRPDSAKLYQESQADAVVTKLVRQHDAAEGWFKYVKKNIENGNSNVALYEQDNSEEDVTADDEISEDAENTKEEIENSETENVEGTENNGAILSGSFQDTIDADRLGYLSKYINGMKVNGLPKAITKIFCVGHDTENAIENEGASIGECLTKNGDLYILTVAPVPVRWQSRDANGESTGVPNTSMRQVLFRYGGAAYRIGYVVTRDFYPEDMKDLTVYVGSDEFELKKFEYIIHNFSYNIDHTQENNEDKQKSIVRRNIVTPIPVAMNEFIEKKCGSKKETNCLVVMSSI